MKIVKMLSILGLFVALSFLFVTIVRAQPSSVANAPTITHAFAADKGHYHNGYTWKIYIEAEAGDAHMFRIASLVDQPGVGSYPPDWIILKPRYQRHLKGYIQWNVRSASGDLTGGTMITLRVSIFDKAGKESNISVFPFTFELGGKDPYRYKLPPPFDQGDLPRLGYIHIDLLPVGGGRE
jgi:hypothetical protein